MSLLIDADYIVYKSCAASESDLDFGEDVIVVVSSFRDAMDMVNRELRSIADSLGTFDDSILFFSSPRNFRKDLKPDYKGHRNRKKPCGYKRVINALREEYPVVLLDNMEADDAIGIYATKEPGHIVVSPDKDLRQIPGQYYNLADPVITITKEEGDRWHFIQTLAGDATDGYSGVPTIGIKRADALLESKGCTWETVLGAFESKGLTAEEALMNARLAKILQHDLYQDDTIKLWIPSDAGNTNDAGAGSQTASAD